MKPPILNEATKDVERKVKQTSTEIWYSSVAAPLATTHSAGRARCVDGGGRMGLCAGVGHPRHECVSRDEPRSPRLLWPEDVTAGGVRRQAAARSRRAAPAAAAAAAPPLALPAVPAALLPDRLPTRVRWLRRAVPAAAHRAELGLAR